jgi:hypothetical protein
VRDIGVEKGAILSSALWHVEKPMSRERMVVNLGGVFPSSSVPTTPDLAAWFKSRGNKRFV